MGHDQRHGIGVAGADVGELNIEPIDPGDELRQAVQLGFRLPPVMLRAPVAREVLDLGQLYALRLVFDGLPVGPPRGQDAPAQVGEFFFRHIDREGADCVGVRRAHC
jgi:hypothetical protein